MNKTYRALGGAALGAVAMYWLDPVVGRRRRARLRDQLASKASDFYSALTAGGQDLANRVHGAAARARSVYEGSKVNDSVLTERVRACLGRVVSHPGAIEVEVVNRCAVLSGAVLAHEFPQLMRTVRAVRGIEEVQDKLSIHASSRGVSALQGGRPRHPARFVLLRDQWSPGTRLLAGAAGGALTILGLSNRSVMGLLSAAAGGALLARSATNVPIGHWVGNGDRSDMAIQVRKTLRVNAPVDHVFQTLSLYENYPLFMHNVRSVRMHPDGRSRWRVAGPAGLTVEWDSITTEFEPNRLIAWRTVGQAPVWHAGMIRFEPMNGATRLDIQMSYQPPGGALGHAVAVLFGADPKSEFDQDLLRLKSYLETGKTPRDAAMHTLGGHGTSSDAAPGPKDPVH